MSDNLPTIVERDGEIEIPVPENPFHVETIRKKRPYLPAELRTRWMEFNHAEQGVLVGRIKELQGRYEQIYFILYVWENDLYLTEADRTISTQLMKDSYFNKWLNELEEVHHIPIAGKWLDRKLSTGKIIDGIATMITGCMGAGMSLEDSVAVASIGETAIERLQVAGAIVKKQTNDGTMAYDRGPNADAVMGQETPVGDYLSEVASTNQSSRGAALRAAWDIGMKHHTFAVWTNKDAPIDNEWKWFEIEISETNVKTGESTPYRARLCVEKDAPATVAKSTLKKMVGENLSRVAYW